MGSLDLSATGLDSDLRKHVVGREREIELILAAVGSGRDLLLEGPPGTSKTTLLAAITNSWGIPLIFVEGNAELTPSRLLGHHDPARVLQEGYTEETFEPGPLVEAMRSGGFFYFEEFNRAPEDTLNTLLTAIADRRVTIPRVGTVEAEPTFRVIGSMNPYDNVGTTRLSVSIKDRLNRLVVDYQDRAAEEEIVRRRVEGIAADREPCRRTIADAVAVTRLTRAHEAISRGSSVRGAIDLTLIAGELQRLRGVDPDRAGDADAYRESFWEAMLVALSGRISLDPATGLSEEATLREVWDQHFFLEGSVAKGEREVELEELPSRRGAEDRSDRGKRAARPRPKQLDSAPELSTGSGGSGLAASAEPAAERGGRRAGSTAFSAEEGAVDDEEGEQARAQREAAHRRAMEIGQLLALQEPPPRRRPGQGGAEIVSLPFNGSGGDIDLDRTLDVLAEGRALDKSEVFVRERRHGKRRIVLLVDASYSRRGERLLTAAATVGALSSRLQRDELAVIAFWSNAALLQRLGERTPVERLIGELLSLDTRGLTNISFPLEIAAAELGGPGRHERRVILLSDCVHNAGPDPRRAAALIPRLDVLFDVEGERDSALAADMARVGRGQVVAIRNHADVAPALNSLLAPAV